MSRGFDGLALAVGGEINEVLNQHVVRVPLVKLISFRGAGVMVAQGIITAKQIS